MSTRPSARSPRPARRRRRSPGRSAGRPAGSAPRRRSGRRWAARRSACCAPPISAMVIIRIHLRPSRSPRVPKKMPPIGRARKPMARVARLATVPAGVAERREEDLAEDQRRRQRVQREVVVLQRAAHRGGQRGPLEIGGVFGIVAAAQVGSRTGGMFSHVRSSGTGLHSRSGRWPPTSAGNSAPTVKVHCAGRPAKDTSDRTCDLNLIQPTERNCDVRHSGRVGRGAWSSRPD